MKWKVYKFSLHIVLKSQQDKVWKIPGTQRSLTPWCWASWRWSWLSDLGHIGFSLWTVSPFVRWCLLQSWLRTLKGQCPMVIYQLHHLCIWKKRTFPAREGTPALFSLWLFLKARITLVFVRAFVAKSWKVFSWMKLQPSFWKHALLNPSPERCCV